jgi:GR25 family glycosyltransferase involved in LPS biosynthesis
MVTWNGIEIADKGFLINLKKRTDRLNESIDEFHRINIRGVEVHQAAEIGIESNFSILSCSQSHLDILNYQVSNSIDKVIIFEDDFFLKEKEILQKLNFEEILFEIKNFDFDLLFLGSSLKEKSNKITPYISKPKIFNQTTCYIIKLECAKFVIDNFDFRNENSICYGEQIDTFYSMLVNKTHWKEHLEFYNKEKIMNNNLKIYMTNPILFYQRRSFSDISKKMVDLSEYVYNLNKLYSE